MNNIQKADPQARRKAILLVACAAAIGAALIYMLERCVPLLADWARGDPAGSRLGSILAVVATLVSLPFLAFSVYLWRLGRGVNKALRFPPPDTKVLRDTPIITGGGALRRGRFFQIIAALLAFAAILILVMLFRMIALFPVA
ncbi:MAG: hypothetical protein ACREV0_04470 [Burkholderiales bacterium]